MKRLLAVLLCGVCIGCQQGVTPTNGSNMMPSDAKVVEHLGNGWSVIEFRADGKPRKFVYRYFQSGNATTEVMAELSD